MSSRPINMLEVNRRVLTRLAVPNHKIRSFQQVAMSEHLTSDMVTRSLLAFSQFCGGPVTEVLANRIVPTKLGNAALPFLDGLFSLAEKQAQQVETLPFAVTTSVPAPILAPAMSRFLEGWRGVVTPAMLIVPSGSQELVRCKEVAFLLSLGEDSPEPDEVLGSAVPATLIVPVCHRLAEVDGMVDAEHFSARDYLLLSQQMAARATEFLARVPSSNRTEIADANLLHHLVSINAGLGLEYSHPAAPVREGCIRVPVVGVEPARLGLWLPRQRERLSEPALALIAAIRDSARDAALPLPTLGSPAETALEPSLTESPSA